MGRQIRNALPLPGRPITSALVLLNQTTTRRQTQTRAFAHSLKNKKGLDGRHRIDHSFGQAQGPVPTMNDLSPS